MRALSIQQPFAQLIVSGLKRLETRPWTTDYRGPLLIHASRSSDAPSSMVRYANNLLAKIGYKTDSLTRGAIIGAVQLFECYSPRQRDLHREVHKLITADEEAIGFWGASYWTWELTSPVEFDKPIFCSGQVGLWEPYHRIITLANRILATVP